MLLLENKDFREFIGLLNSKKDRFLIVGGHAVSFHGAPRFTGDLDIWVAIDSANAARIEEVLRDFGFGKFFRSEDFSKPGYAIQLGRPPYRIDILTSIDAVEFAQAYKRRKALHADGLKLVFIGLEELLANKRATGRFQDLADAAKLEGVQRPVRRKARPKRWRRV
jgi:predicted nucleotidyltransferase